MRNHCIGPAVLCGLLLLVPTVKVAAEPPTEEQVRFFETKIRPVFASHCYRCHGDERQRAGLRLDSHEAILAGGESGVILVPGKPEESRLIAAVRHMDGAPQMPPNDRLSDRQIADLTAWVAMGAPYPDAEAASAANASFWSFQPPSDPAVPAVKNTAWPRTALDHFILAELEAAGLEPAPPADKRTLIRRVTFDLTGLPPTREEIAAFLADESPEAFAKVVDRLLGSPHYGERWGRHWLDVARYADSNGLDENVAHGNAWRYRDYVVSAFNKDKPYDRFLLEQIAGDLLPAEDQATRHEQLIATGFLVLGPKVLAEPDERKMEMDIVDEQLDTFGRAVLGLTLGCARCHDHKFDPIATADYYALAGIFKSTRSMETFKKVARWHENSIATEEDLARKAAHDARVAEHKRVIQAVVDRANEALKATLGPDAKLPEKPESKYPAETQAELKKLRDELKEIEKEAPEMPTAMGVTEGEVTNVAIHIRGDHLTLGNVVPRGVPKVLAGSNAPRFADEMSGRLALAEWLVRPDHPLTARVMVNRIWRWHFGEGLTRSPDNFGRLGEPPQNQALLDWLSHRFIEQGWSIKKMHRMILLSSTYQMSSHYNPKAAATDPENRLRWRADIRRLEAEAIRDSLLAVAGTLDLTMGGAVLPVKNRAYLFDHTSKDVTKYDNTRRSIYQPIVRNNLYDVFQLFDFADPSVLNGNRATTTVAPQALFMMNSDIVAEASDRFATRLLAREDLDDAGRIALAFEEAYGRPVREEEIARSRRHLDQVSAALSESEPDSTRRNLAAWSSLCQTILAANEFIYVR